MDLCVINKKERDYRIKSPKNSFHFLHEKTRSRNCRFLPSKTTENIKKKRRSLKLSISGSNLRLVDSWKKEYKSNDRKRTKSNSKNPSSISHSPIWPLVSLEARSIFVSDPLLFQFLPRFSRFLALENGVRKSGHGGLLLRHARRSLQLWAGASTGFWCRRAVRSLRFGSYFSDSTLLFFFATEIDGVLLRFFFSFPMLM